MNAFWFFCRHVLHGVAQLVDDAMLDFGFRVKAFNGFRKAFESIHTSDQEVFDASIVQISQHAEPMMRAFLSREIQPQPFFLTLNIEARNGVYRCLCVTPVFLDLIVDGIQLDNGVDRLQIALTPGLKLSNELVRNRIEDAVGQAHAIDSSDMTADILVAGA